MSDIEIKTNVVRKMLEEILKETYTLIGWPESQKYMDLDWFESEAVLHPNEPSAYFIPTHRLLEGK